MPNWCTNHLYIYGRGAEDAIAFMKSEKSIFDFNRILPMPKDLEITSGSEEHIGYERVSEVAS